MASRFNFSFPKHQLSSVSSGIEDATKRVYVVEGGTLFAYKQPAFIAIEALFCT